MKVAVASVGTDVATHFGHCENFAIFEIENNQIINERALPNPGHEPGVLPRLLAQEGVSVVITGGMGSRAQDLFLQQNIQPVFGVRGSVAEVIQAYINKNLNSGNNLCDH